MPYIEQSKRNPLDSPIELLYNKLDEVPNDELCEQLDYAISKLFWCLCGHDGQGEKSYARINAVIGAIENVKHEFCRRIVVPYKDDKLEDNGDIQH